MQCDPILLGVLASNKYHKLESFDVVENFSQPDEGFQS